MKSFKKTFVVFFLCISLVIPKVSVHADDIDDNNETEGIAGIAEPESGFHGSGSFQLNEVDSDYRFYTEYFVKADTKKSIKTAGIDRKTDIKVYAKEGEIILFGSSVSNSQIDENNKYTGSVTGKDIVITTPSGEKVIEDVIFPGDVDSDNIKRPNGLGYIKNPTQEKNGPMVNHDNEEHPDKYYVPLKYTVKESGVYTFEFHSVTGFNPNSASSGYHPTPKKVSENWAQGNTAVAAWDITVLGKKTGNEWEVKSGRAWADYLALTTAGGEGVKSDLDVHVLTHDGYQYKIDFKEAVPYGFIFFANNTGFMTEVTDEDNQKSTHRPIYHSFYDPSNDLDYMSAENIYLHKPNEADTATEETYKIFFNAPNDDLNGVTYIKNGKTELIKTEPSEAVIINDLVFSGGGYQNIARAGHGGYFNFNASDEAMITIRLDLKKAIWNSGSTIQGTYNGSGIVEITVPIVKGNNSVYWDGKDTEGIVIPAGIYGNSNVIISTEIKRGELHFPIIDMEGLYNGLVVHRINGNNTSSSESYNIYYNNNPLAYGNIEGSGYKKTADGPYYVLSDGTKSYKSCTDKSATLSKFFTGGQESISTLKKDDKEYLAQKLFGTSYTSLSTENKEIIDAEFDGAKDTFHYEPVNSNTTKLMFECEKYDGGGNQAGIDVWTYYSQEVDAKVISFAIMDGSERGIIKGQIFHDTNISSSYDDGDYYLSGVKVRLIDSQGNPLVHNEKLPSFDNNGHFLYDQDGNIIHEDASVIYEAVTDSTGTYRFTGVPYSITDDTTYYVQVQLSDVQSEVLRYTCTTSEKVKEKYKTSNGSYFLSGAIDTVNYGSDGNKIVEAFDGTKIYRHKYERDLNNEIVFDKYNAQAVTFTSSDITSELICTKELKKIGYSSTIPTENQMDYKVTKNWGIDSQGNETHRISDGIIVELWVWNDTDVEEENKLQLSRRTGALVDTHVLNEDNGWTYVWKELDNRLQYYVLEYYTKKKANGEIMYNDNGEARRVLIGGTMPIYSDESTVPADGVYDFKVDLGEYKEAYTDSTDGKNYIPIQKFSAVGDNIHANSITDKEKLESAEVNARQYEVTYKLSVSGRTNTIELINRQIFDDRAYYVWQNHQTELPEFVSQTYVEDGKKKSHALQLTKDKLIADDTYTVKGLSVSSLDAAMVENSEGNATSAFRIKENGKNVLFTATNHGNYKTGVGTRTYQVKYVVDAITNDPVSVTTNNDGELVLSDNTSEKVESNNNYKVYTWIMTIHVYDVQTDGVIEYDPNGGEVILQEALNHGDELTWTLTHDGENYNSISYTSDDTRKNGLLQNDTYRVPLFKSSEEQHMGSCADLVGITYAGTTTVEDVSELVFEDTYESRYGLHNSEVYKEDGKAVAQGQGGFVTVSLNTLRGNRINRVQDHANYASITFTPNTKGRSDTLGLSEDVFYYEIIVFAEDSTYQYNDYDDINASEGVVMYASFKMKPIEVETPTENPSNSVDTNEETTEDTIDTIDKKNDDEDNNPKTSDNINMLLWIKLELFSACVFVLWSYLLKKRNIKK